MQVGDRVRVLSHNGLRKLIPVGEIAVIRFIEPDAAGLEGDDIWVYKFEHLELVDDEDDEPVEWMDLTSYVIFYVSEDAIQNNDVEESVCCTSYTVQGDAEAEIDWFTRHNYKILASKKLTTRVRKP